MRLQLLNRPVQCLAFGNETCTLECEWVKQSCRMWDSWYTYDTAGERHFVAGVRRRSDQLQLYCCVTLAMVVGQCYWTDRLFNTDMQLVIRDIIARDDQSSVYRYEVGDCGLIVNAAVRHAPATPTVRTQSVHVRAQSPAVDEWQQSSRLRHTSTTAAGGECRASVAVRRGRHG